MILLQNMDSFCYVSTLNVPLKTTVMLLLITVF